MAACVSCRSPVGARQSRASRPARFFFVSQGQTALISADGTGLRYLEFDVPNQATWQPVDFFSDGRRVLFLSMEPRRDGPGRPFEEYYTQTPTRLWIYDLDSGSLKKITMPDRMAPFCAPQLLLEDERMLVQVFRNKVGQTFSMNQRPDTDHFNRDYKPDLARGGTEICRLDPRDNSVTRLTSSDPPVWDFRVSESPDGQWIVFCRAATGDVPAVWVMDADGRHPRQITKGPDECGVDHPRWLPVADR